MSNETMKDGERAAFEAWWVRDVPEAYRAHARQILHDSFERNGKYHNEMAQAAWEGVQFARTASQATVKCATCNGHGEIGGLLPNGGGYDSEPCPDCAAAPQAGATLTDEQRTAIAWAADRAHVASLGKPIDGTEGLRWRVLKDLLATSQN